jgi:hypothetical protein
MATYIKKSYFLLLMIKLHGENLTAENEKEKKTQINNLFNALTNELMTPLDDLKRLYEQLIEAFLPAEGNQPEPLNNILQIPGDIVSLGDEDNPKPPPHHNIKENSSYISLTHAKELALRVLGQNYSDELDENHTITYQDLSWLRQERHAIRSEEYGNTDTYRSIALKIKEAILERLYTLGNKIGEQAEWPAEEYDRYLGMMQKNCGRHPILTKFFGCSTESKFNKLISKGNANSPDPIALDPS